MTDSIAVAAEWDRNSEAWAANLKAGNDLINECFGMPLFLDEIGDLHGLDVLDAGCGEGRSSRHLAAKGANVIGVDISPGMIAHALSREAAEHQGIDFQLASCADLNSFPEEHFDLVTSFMALMDTPGLSIVLSEFYRVLRVGGRLAIAIRHPCHFTPGFSILKNQQRQRAGLTVAGYFAEQPYKEHWRFPGQEAGDFEVTRFPYTLADYVNSMIEQGFTITGLREPKPTEEMCLTLPSLRFWQLHGALYLFLIGAKR